MDATEKTTLLKAVKIIVDARKLISKESDWSQWSNAMNAKFQSTRPTSGNAVRWSMSGSLLRAWYKTDKTDTGLLEKVFKHVQHYAKGDFVEMYDANHTHREVLDLLAKAARGAAKAKKLFS